MSGKHVGEGFTGPVSVTQIGGGLTATCTGRMSVKHVGDGFTGLVSVTVSHTSVEISLKRSRAQTPALFARFSGVVLRLLHTQDTRVTE